MAAPNSSTIAAAPDPATTNTNSAAVVITASTTGTRPFLTNHNPPLLPLPQSFAPHSTSILGRPPNPPPPPQSIIFPFARTYQQRPGSLRPPPSDQIVTIANSVGYIGNSNPTAVLAYAPTNHPQRPFGYSHLQQQHQLQQQQQQPMALVRPQAQPHPQLNNIAPHFAVPRQVSSSAAANGLSPADSHPRVAPPPTQAKTNPFPSITSTPEYNSYKDMREKCRDDSLVTVHDRKVRLVECPSGSLYTLCRSWVRNGSQHEAQPSFGDGVKLLPRPLPRAMIKTAALQRDNEEDVVKKEEPADYSEDMSTKDLLQGHIKRSKRVREKLKEERHQRIDRYKQRLSLLLPLPIEQNRSAMELSN